MPFFRADNIADAEIQTREKGGTANGDRYETFFPICSSS